MEKDDLLTCWLAPQVKKNIKKDLISFYILVSISDVHVNKWVGLTPIKDFRLCCMLILLLPFPPDLDEVNKLLDNTL